MRRGLGARRRPARRHHAAAGAGPVRAAPQPAHRPLPPAEPETIKRAIRDTDAHAADAALCAWLRQEAAAGRVRVRHLAAGGKTVRGARDKAGHAPHLLAARDVTGGTVAAKLDVAARHNEITYFAGLLACLSDPAPAGAGHDSDSDDEDTCRGETGSDAGSKGCITLITADALCRRVDYAEVRSETQRVAASRIARSA